MKNLCLATCALLSVTSILLGCETSKQGLGNGGPDSGAGQGGSGSGGAATGGSRATGGINGSGGSGGSGAAGQAGSSGLGSGGSGGAMGSGGTTSGAGGTPSTGGATTSGGSPGGSGTGGIAAGGGRTGSGGGPATGGSPASDGGTRAGGAPGSGGNGLGGRGAGGAATGGSIGSAGGATGTGGVVGSGGATGIGGVGGSGGSSGGLGGFGGHKACQSDADCAGFKCCGNLCSNLTNDILNCGSCGQACPGPNPYCNSGTCGTPPCQGNTCGGMGACCGGQCCGAGQLCCMVNLGPSVLGCFDPVDGTCPTGCAACACAAPTTPIATPLGERPIAELKVGDWVYSVDHNQLRPVPIKRINRQAVPPTHTMVQVRLASGRTLTISPLHPTADGRTFRDLARGRLLDGVAVVEARVVAYHQPYTYDILPDSDSGAYFAAGVLVGSTLATPRPEPLASGAQAWPGAIPFPGTVAR
jgi:hypothetical protein